MPSFWGLFPTAEWTRGMHVFVGFAPLLAIDCIGYMLYELSTIPNSGHTKLCRLKAKFNTSD